MKLTPEECYFDANSEVNSGITRIQLVIFPKDKNHPLVDRLSNENLSKLPEYLQNRWMDAENLWDWDGDAPKSLEGLREDMRALGYEEQRGLTFF
tara:strand:+ start:286 stop:570 length:285 start_codon:yes stop_codon:yes gene_type:complete